MVEDQTVGEALPVSFEHRIVHPTDAQQNWLRRAEFTFTAPRDIGFDKEDIGAMPFLASKLVESFIWPDGTLHIEMDMDADVTNEIKHLGQSELGILDRRAAELVPYMSADGLNHIDANGHSALWLALDRTGDSTIEALLQRLPEVELHPETQIAPYEHPFKTSPLPLQTTLLPARIKALLKAANVWTERYTEGLPDLVVAALSTHTVPRELSLIVIAYAIPKFLAPI
jgi:hypothetical protein